MSAGSLSSVDSGTESVHQEEEIHSSEDDLSPPRDLNEPAKRVDQTIPWKEERPATSVSTRRQRPKSKSGSAKPKNNRPKSCHVSSQYAPEHPGYVEYLRPFSAFRPPLKRVVNIPDAFSNSHLLQHPNLSEGQKTYLWHTASVYSVSNLKLLQQRRYEQMIQHQVDIGLHSPKDCERYIKYLLGQRQRQFEVDPRIWRNPPRIAPRGRFYHRRDKTVDYESGDDEDIEQDAPPRRPQTAVTSSRYGRLTTSKSRPQTATSGHGRPNTSKSRPKPAYEKKFPSGQPSDKHLYYDTKDRQLKSPDQREKEEEIKREKREKKEKKEWKKKEEKEKKEKKEKEEKEKKEKEEKEERSKRKEKTSQSNEKESPKKTQNSENNSVEKKESKEKKAKKKERKHEQKNNEEIEIQKEETKKPNKKKESPKRASVKNSKENTKEDENNKTAGNTRRKSVKKDKTLKEPIAEVANDNVDADDRAIETVQEDNDLVKKTDNEDTAVGDSKPTEAETVNDRTNTQSKVKIFVGEEPNEQEDYEKEDYDDIDEFDPIFENRLQKKQQDDTVSVYSSFSVDIPITRAQAPSELEY